MIDLAVDIRDMIDAQERSGSNEVLIGWRIVLEKDGIARIDRHGAFYEHQRFGKHLLTSQIHDHPLAAIYPRPARDRWQKCPLAVIVGLYCRVLDAIAHESAESGAHHFPQIS
jgi:hypothetical protein